MLVLAGISLLPERGPQPPIAIARLDRCILPDHADQHRLAQPTRAMYRRGRDHTNVRLRLAQGGAQLGQRDRARSGQ